MWNRSEDKINCIFIRHGCTVSNREHRYLGRTDEPLDEAGVFELENALNNGVYKALEENSLKEQIIITSPMRRCKQTAEIILPVAQHHKIHTVKEFAEMDFGEWELKSYKELSTDIRFRDSYQAWIDSGGTLAFPNGESRKEFCKRSICGFERALTQALELKRAIPDKEIQIVFFVHGGSIMAIMSHYCDMDYYDYQVKNGCGYSCEVAVEGNEIVFNEIVPISL